MNAFLSFACVQKEEEEDAFQSDAAVSGPNETTPLIVGANDATHASEAKWKPGPGFIWIEVGKL